MPHRAHVLTLAALVAATPAAARPPRPDPAARAAALAPLEATANDCFAEALMSNPGAMAKAREGKWYEAAGVVGFLCRPEVGRLMHVVDTAEGPGAGMRFFRKVYARRLQDVLAARVGPVLSRKAYATAEPPADAPDSGDGPSR